MYVDIHAECNTMGEEKGACGGGELSAYVFKEMRESGKHIRLKT